RQLVHCPDGPNETFGIPFTIGEDCKLDRNLHVVDLDPAVFKGIANNGKPYGRNTQKYGTLELNYNLAPELALTSTTGFYDLRSGTLANVGGSAAAPTLGIENRFRRRDYTQEVRI